MSETPETGENSGDQATEALRERIVEMLKTV